MNRKSEQQRLNEALAYELDKYQVILEYGRVKLAVSNEIRKKMSQTAIETSKSYDITEIYGKWIKLFKS